MLVRLPRHLLLLLLTSFPVGSAVCGESLGNVPVFLRLDGGAQPVRQETTAATPFERAMTAMGEGQYEAARLLFMQARKGLSIHDQPLAWMTISFNACQAFVMQGKGPEAEAFALQITQTCEKALGLEDPLTGEALAYQAFVLKMHDNLEDAEPVYRRTAEVLEAKYGPRHAHVVAAVSRHGALLHMLGRLSEAEQIQRRALGIMQEIGDSDDPGLCQPLTNLAFCLHAQGKTREAAPLMKQAFLLVRKHSDASITSASTVLRRQAEYFRDTGKLEWAEELGSRALLRLARRPEFNRARFYYYDIITDLYRSILKARGLEGVDIDQHIRNIESAALTPASAAASE